MNKTDTHNEAKRFKAINFAIAKLDKTITRWGAKLKSQIF
jgi:hypothetical protein